MQKLVVLLLRSVSGAKQPSVGVCWTRNLVSFDLNAEGYGVVWAEWEQVYASALSAYFALNRSQVKTCLFTDAPERVARFAIEGTGRPRSQELFSVFVAEPSLIEFVDAVIERALNRSEAWHAMAQSKAKFTLFASRLKRMYNVWRAPFGVTLFVDDDTVFCPNPALAADLRSLAAPNTVRIVEHSWSKPLHDFDVDRERTRLETCYPTCWNDASCDTFVSPPPALQGGAILVRGDTLATRAFATDWMREYISHWSSSANLTARAAGNDQRPLDNLAKRQCQTPRGWYLAALPPIYNARFLTDKLFLTPVAGRVTVIHSHGFHRWALYDAFIDVLHRQVCDRINADQGPRSLALDAIALLRDGIRERLRGGGEPGSSTS